MLYHRDALKAAALAVSKDPIRFALQGVHLDGKLAVGTDGSILIAVPAGPHVEDDFPIRFGDGKLDCAPATIDAKSILEAVKATPRDGVMPILQCVQIAGDGEMRQLRATNLDRDHNATVRTLGQYPKWEQVLDLAVNEPAKFSVGLAVDVVLKAFKALQAAGVDAVKVDFRDPYKALVLSGSSDLGEVLSIVMPYRLPEVK